MRVRALLCALLAAPGLLAADAGEDWQAWFARMQRAQSALNYDATVVIDQGKGWEAFELSQRIGPNGVEQRVQGLTGEPARLLRSGQGMSLLTEGSDTRLATSPQPSMVPDPRLLARSYRVELGADERVAGRQARQVAVLAQDASRFSLRVWIDRDTGLPLRSERLAEGGSLIERQMVTRLVVHGFAAAAGPAPVVAASASAAAELSGGFQLLAMPAMVPGLQGASHAIVGDGLVRVSVYRVPLRFLAGLPAEAWQRGATGKVVLQGGEEALFVIGELPPATLRAIAAEMSASAPNLDD